MIKRGKPPELPPEVAEGLNKLAKGVAKEMSPGVGERRRLFLNEEEVKAVRRMNNEEFSSFLLEKGIFDFMEPVLLVTPDGTAEEWMRSAEQIRAFLGRHNLN